MANGKFTSDVVIGLEIHIELDTNTKLFCGCSTKADSPNSATCPVCLGMPGSKPVLNKKAVDYAMKLSLALGCKLAKQIVFSRKSYFYPDLAKNYQITQFEIPLGAEGSIELSDGKKVKIRRVHMEEDPASLVHHGSIQCSKTVLVDYNRSGRPLCEIVTDPDMESPAQAREFMRKLITLLSYLGIFEHGRCVIKADANISIRESGYVRSEVKNVTGFKEIERALEYELLRQKKEVRMLIQDTRGWDTSKGVTFRMRTKESEEDYGYIVDPDLVPIVIDKSWVDSIKKSLPVLPAQLAKKFVKEFHISPLDADILCSDKSLAGLFEKLASKFEPKLCVRWMRFELMRAVNLHKVAISSVDVPFACLKELLELAGKNAITDKVGKELMELIVKNAIDGKEFSVKRYVEKNNLGVLADSGELEKFCKETISDNPKAVDDFKKGNEKALNFVVGQVMKKTKGKAAPNVVMALLKKLVR